MTHEKNKDDIYVKNAVDYEYLNGKDKSSNIVGSSSSFGIIRSCSDSDSSSIEEKIINILNFRDNSSCSNLEVDDSSSSNFDIGDDLNNDLNGDSDGSQMDGINDDSVDDLDDSDFDEELEFLCSLGLEPFEEGQEATGINKGSFDDYFNPHFENNPEELAFLYFFNDFILVEMSFNDRIKEVYFDE